MTQKDVAITPHIVTEKVFTCPSSMSLCRPERSCSVLLVLRIDRLWDFLFCLAWRAAALLPLSTGIPSSKLDFHNSLKVNRCRTECEPKVCRLFLFSALYCSVHINLIHNIKDNMPRDCKDKWQCWSLILCPFPVETKSFLKPVGWQFCRDALW